MSTNMLLLQYALLLPRTVARGCGSERRGSLVGGWSGHSSASGCSYVETDVGIVMLWDMTVRKKRSQTQTGRGRRAAAGTRGRKKNGGERKG